MSYTKVVNQKLNKGKDCPNSSSFPDKELDCTKDKDCEITLRENDSGCIDGRRTIKYNIDKLNSGNGKDCKQ